MAAEAVRVGWALVGFLALEEMEKGKQGKEQARQQDRERRRQQQAGRKRVVVVVVRGGEGADRGPQGRAAGSAWVRRRRVVDAGC